MLPSLQQLACRMCPLDTRGGKGDHGAKHGQHGDWRLWTPLMVHKSSRPNISLNNQTLLLCSPDPQNWFSFATKDGSWFWAADVLCAYNPSSIKCTVWCRVAALELCKVAMLRCEERTQGAQMHTKVSIKSFVDLVNAESGSGKIK